MSTHLYFIRHAEKDRYTRTTDPHLTPEGRERAQRWKAYFADKNIDRIYCTPLKRTQETAKPTAQHFDINIEIYRGITGFIEKFKADNAGKNVLIVGHQDTTPHFINSILGEEKYSMISAGQHDKVFHLKLDKDTVIAEEITRID